MKHKSYESSYATKQVICASLKKLMAQKPLEKITISEIMDDCGMVRQHFYYHFEDIYDLVRWMFQEEAVSLLKRQEGALLWQEGLLQIFEAVLENKPFILNVYRTLSREQIENYLFRLVYDLIMGVVEEKAAGLRVTQQQKQFVAEFYKYSFVCVMLDWIRGGMKDDYHTIVNDICTTMHGAISNSLRNFADSDKYTAL